MYLGNIWRLRDFTKWLLIVKLESSKLLFLEYDKLKIENKVSFTVTAPAL